MRHINGETIRYLGIIYSFLLFVLFFLISDPPINEGYIYTILLPLFFIICFFGFLYKPLIKYKTPYLITFTIVAFARYVILPYVTLSAGDYHGIAYVSPKQENLQLASLLMIYELLLVSIVIRVLADRKLGKIVNHNNYLFVQKSNFVYVAFFLVFLVMIILLPQAREGISFFMEVNRANNDEIGNVTLLLIRKFFVDTKFFIFFAILIFIIKKKELRKKFLVYLFILILALIIMNLNIGTNRKTILSDAFALFFLLVVIFPKRKKHTMLVLGAVATIMFVGYSIYRGFINHEGIQTLFSLDTLQVYLLGEYNVALAIETKDMFHNSIGIQNVMMDIFRPFIGIGTIISDISVPISGELFSKRLSYGMLYRDDQIIPMIGQGYIYFGFLFSPLYSIIIAITGVYCDYFFEKSQSIETIFYSSYLSINIAQAMILNFTILINLITYSLAIAVIIIILNKAFNAVFNKNKEKSSLIKIFLREKEI